MELNLQEKIKSRKFSLSIILLILLFVFAGCTDEDETEPIIYTPGCSAQNLIGHINQANASPNPAIIELDPDCVYTLTAVEHTYSFSGLDINSGLPGITNEIVIMGNNAVIDIQPAEGEDYFGHLFVYAQGELDLYDLTLQNGRRIHGGAIFNLEGSVFASNVIFQNNQAFGAGADFPGFGGAVYNQNGLFRAIEESLFLENMATNVTTPHGNKGGAIYSLNGGLTIYNTTFALNYSGDQGGGVYIERNGSGEEVEGSLFDDVTFDSNTARSGGGIFTLNENSVFIISKSLFILNEASDHAGVLDINSSTLSITLTDFRRNSSGINVGVLSISDSEVDIDNSSFSINLAQSCGALSIDSNSIVEIEDSQFFANRAENFEGGAICHIEGDLLIEDSDFSTNQALTYGGAIYATDPIEINRTVFTSNIAENGGSLFLGHTELGDGSVPTQMDFNTRIVDSSFSNNQVGGNGGAIWFHTAQNLLVLRSTIDNNTASGYGGGVKVLLGNVYVTNSTISSNYAQRGGGIHMLGYNHTSHPVLQVTNSTVAYNTAWEEEQGGGIFMYNDATLKNSIIANNTNYDCRLHQHMNYTRAGENIDTDGTCGVTTADPLLGSLASNGGETQTHALGASSPAIDLVPDCTGLTEDQRGVARPQNNACDLGSYEFEGIPSPPPPPPAPSPTPTETAVTEDPTDTAPTPTATNTSIPPTPTNTVEVKGQVMVHVWMDTSNNGLQDNNEADYAGIVILLGNGACDDRAMGHREAITDATGDAWFYDLSFNTYCVYTTVVPTPGEYSIASTDDEVTVVINAGAVWVVEIGYATWIE